MDARYTAADRQVLLVSFDTPHNLSSQSCAASHHLLASARGWSRLAISTRTDDWFRNPGLWAFFDELMLEEFLDDFDQVIFFGAGMGAHAACAFSVCQPGAQVLAIRPVATLDPGLTSWDKRWPEARRLDFRTRFSQAHELSCAASRVWLVHDPAIDEDAMHAALFHRAQLMRLDCRWLGPAPERALADMGLIAELLDAIVAGQMDIQRWGRLWRRRRSHPGWLRNMSHQLAEHPDRRLELRFLRAALALDADQPRLRQRLDDLCAAMARPMRGPWHETLEMAHGVR